MSFYVDYLAPEEFDPSGAEKQHRAVDMDRTRLVGSCFRGSLRMEAGSVDLSPDPERILPLLHAFLGLTRVADALQRGEDQEVYHFTEAGSWVSFRRFGREVAVAASYSQWIGATTPQTIREGLTPAAAQLVRRIERACPDIREHPAWPDITATLTRPDG